MAVSSKRGQKIYDIDPNNFNSLCIKGYIRTYFKDGSLNIATGVPILVTDRSFDWIDICISDDHPFYNLFKELSKDNKELYNTYFKEKYSSKVKDIITLRVNGENIQEIKQFCKLDVKVRILFKEEIIFTSESDPEYFNQWKFLLDINRIEFM